MCCRVILLYSTNLLLKQRTVKTVIHSYNLFPIDCAAKAYLLGFIACDSSLYEPSNKMSLEIADESVMKFFSEMMEHPYVKYEKFDKRTNKTYTGYRIYRCISDICSYYNGRLKHERIIPYNLVPLEYMSYLMQGIFDADGTLSMNIISKTNIGVRIEFASSPNIIQTVQDIFLNITGHIYQRTKGSYVSLFIYNRKDFFTFLQWIYKPWFLPLPRKYEKACHIYQCILAQGKPHLLPKNIDTLNTTPTKPFVRN